MKQTETGPVIDLLHAPATAYVLPEGTRGLICLFRQDTHVTLLLGSVSMKYPATH